VGAAWHCSPLLKIHLFINKYITKYGFCQVQKKIILNNLQIPAICDIVYKTTPKREQNLENQEKTGLTGARMALDAADVDDERAEPTATPEFA
jgi:hypothetical protein